MRKVFKMEELDCANCAAKMEMGIAQFDGVISANISFMAQKLTIEAEEEMFDEIMKEAVKVCRRVEPDCRIVIK